MEYPRSNTRVVEACVRLDSVRTGMPGLSLVSDANTQVGGIVGKRNCNGTDIGPVKLQSWDFHSPIPNTYNRQLIRNGML